jgi:hypothetical protein
VTRERAHGLQLYALAAVLLIGGIVWFFRTEPYVGADPRVLAWQATVIREVPDVQPQVGSGTLMIGSGAEREARAPVDGGSFTLTMVCAGIGQVRGAAELGGQQRHRARGPLRGRTQLGHPDGRAGHRVLPVHAGGNERGGLPLAPDAGHHVTN